MPSAKDDFKAVNLKVSGTVKLMVNVKKVLDGSSRASFKWQYSPDNITWTDVPSTLRGTTTLSGLKSLSVYHFRFLAILKGGETGWSEPISLKVL